MSAKLVKNKKAGYWHCQVGDGGRSSGENGLKPKFKLLATISLRK